MPTRALIVDDEALAREKIRQMLASEPDILIVGECRSGREAVRMIRSQKPDLVFLDVQMPELGGFGVLKAVGVERAPAVIFVTAYDQYALQAFEVNAVDYLLKPFDRERFRKAVSRFRTQVGRSSATEMSARLDALLRGLEGSAAHIHRLAIRSSGRIFFLKTEEIAWIGACGNYVGLHVGPETHLLRESMNAMETKLDPSRFVRIHRSALVNIDHVKELRPLFHGEYAVLLKNGDRLTLSRGFRVRLEALLKRTS